MLWSVPQQVKLIVQNALRLYSQDRTGLVDYALESGGKKSHIGMSASPSWAMIRLRLEMSD